MSPGALVLRDPPVAREQCGRRELHATPVVLDPGADEDPRLCGQHSADPRLVEEDHVDEASRAVGDRHRGDRAPPVLHPPRCDVRDRHVEDDVGALLERSECADVGELARIDPATGEVAQQRVDVGDPALRELRPIGLPREDRAELLVPAEPVRLRDDDVLPGVVVTQHRPPPRSRSAPRRRPRLPRRRAGRRCGCAAVRSRPREHPRR